MADVVAAHCGVYYTGIRATARNREETVGRVEPSRHRERHHKETRCVQWRGVSSLPPVSSLAGEPSPAEASAGSSAVRRALDAELMFTEITSRWRTHE